MEQSFFWPCLNHSSSCFEQPFFLTSILLGIRSGLKKQVVAHTQSIETLTAANQQQHQQLQVLRQEMAVMVEERDELLVQCNTLKSRIVTYLQTIQTLKHHNAEVEEEMRGCKETLEEVEDKLEGTTIAAAAVAAVTLTGTTTCNTARTLLTRILYPCTANTNTCTCTTHAL